MGIALLGVALPGMTPPAFAAGPAGGGFRLALGGAAGWGWGWEAGAWALTLPVLYLLVARRRPVNAISSPGFEVITASEKRTFIPLEEKFQHMDFLNAISTRGVLRLSANLNRVNLSHRRFGYLLEDKNYRNALLVNRRRVRRTLLRDGDVLDMGDLTLLYRDNRQTPLLRRVPGALGDGKVQINFDRARGPVRKGTPMLVLEQQPPRVFYLTKNLVFLGRSETNDVVIKSPKVNFRHAKIERVGSRYKLFDLANTASTFVNNRRVEQRVLREGDEIAIENNRFRFKTTARPVSEHQPPPAFSKTAPQQGEEENPTPPPEAGETEA